jgi:hypothetical protein
MWPVKAFSVLEILDTLKSSPDCKNKTEVVLLLYQTQQRKN